MVLGSPLRFLLGDQAIKALQVRPAVRKESDPLADADTISVLLPRELCWARRPREFLHFHAASTSGLPAPPTCVAERQLWRSVTVVVASWACSRAGSVVQCG